MKLIDLTKKFGEYYLINNILYEIEDCLEDCLEEENIKINIKETKRPRKESYFDFLNIEIENDYELNIDVLITFGYYLDFYSNDDSLDNLLNEFFDNHIINLEEI